jgi:hypothetical protein
MAYTCQSQVTDTDEAAPLDLSDFKALAAVRATGIAAVAGMKTGWARLVMPARLQRAVFPLFEQPTVVATGTMISEVGLDPEDLTAAIAVLNCLCNVFSRRRERQQITYFDTVGAVDPSAHLVAIGGPLSNPLNRDLGHITPFRRASRPTTPLYLFHNLRGREQIVRRFKGRDHWRPRWKIVDAVARLEYLPHTDRDGWLTRDYLVVTVQPRPTAANPARIRVSFMGMYGTGVMATELLLSNLSSTLTTLNAKRAGSPYFQSLFTADDINHSDAFSVATHLHHIQTYILPSA